MSFDSGSDLKAMGNNFALNAASLFFFDKVLAPHLIGENEGEMKKLLLSAGLVTGIEELKAVMMRAGYGIRGFKQYVFFLKK